MNPTGHSRRWLVWGAEPHTARLVAWMVDRVRYDGVRAFWFTDDNFIRNPRHMELLERLAEARAQGAADFNEYFRDTPMMAHPTMSAADLEAELRAAVRALVGAEVQPSRGPSALRRSAMAS